MENYTLSVKRHTVWKIYTVCIIIHCVKFCVNRQKFLSLEIFYTTAGSGCSDYYQVCTEPVWEFPLHKLPSNCLLNSQIKTQKLELVDMCQFWVTSFIFQKTKNKKLWMDMQQAVLLKLKMETDSSRVVL